MKSKNNCNQTRRTATRAMKWLGVGVLALFAAAFIPTAIAHPEVAATCAIAGILPLSAAGLRGARFAPMDDDASFQSSVLSGLGEVKQATDKMKANQEKIKSDYETLGFAHDDLAAKVLALQRLNLSMRTGTVSGDAKARLLENPEKREILSAAIRRAVQAPLTDAHRRALGQDSSPGSTLVTDQLLPELYDTLLQYGAWSSLGVRRVSAKVTKLPVSTARATANWYLTEGGEIADDTTKTGTSVNLEMEVCAALINVSRQLIDDAAVDVADDVLNDFIEAINERIDFAAFQGSGASDGTHGGFTGIFNAGTAATAAEGNSTVEALDLEDFIRCLTAVDPAVLARKAKWWIHPQILARICSIRDGNGRSIFQTALEAPAPGAIGSILGYPVVLTSAAPSVNAAEAKVACFGDPDGCVVGVRTDFAFEMSDHHKWDSYQRSFRAVARAGVKVRRAQAFSVLTLPAA